MAKGGRKISTGTIPGRVGRRTTKALKRLERLVAKFKADGLSATEAKKRAMEIMRDNPRADWREG